MEGVYSNNNNNSNSLIIPANKFITKLNDNNSNNLSPIGARTDNQFFSGPPQPGGYYRHHHPPPISPRFEFDPFASPQRGGGGSILENLDSPLITYLRSGSPAADNSGDSYKSPVIDKYNSMIDHQYRRSSGNSSSGRLAGSPFGVENLLEIPPSSSRSPPVFNLKVEEDVVVMDAIQIGSFPGSRMRSSWSSDSGSGGSSSGGSKSFYKSEICRSWEDSGVCRYGIKCQFAHGKEELRPTRGSYKNKSESLTCRSYSSGSCTFGSKCRFIHQQSATAASPTGSPLFSSVTPSKSPIQAPVVSAATRTVSPLKPKHATGSTITSASTRWSPQDDGIMVALPSASTDKPPSREEVDAYIQSVLYGPIRKTLPVFAELCPDVDTPLGEQ